jgi:cytochrome c biogenesis protein
LEEEKKITSATDRVWAFLASVKLAIAVFAAIALTSIVGTVLEQGSQPERNVEILRRLFGESLAPSLYDIFLKLGFMNMYSSWWFMALLVLFSVNLVICSLDRLPRIWKLVREPVSPLTDEKIRRSPINREVVFRGKPEKVRESVRKELRAMRLRFGEVREEKAVQFFGQKGSLSRLGVYVTHFSILVILLGAIIGVRFGFKGYLTLQEGTVAHGFISSADREIPFGFGLRCDSFEVEFYGESDMPREYRSWLTVIENGKEVHRKAITVNNPLRYEGITFYQSSYGLVPGGMNRGIFVLQVSSTSTDPTSVYPLFGRPFEIPGTGLAATIVDFSPALRIDEHGHTFTYAGTMNNPAIFVKFSEDGKEKFSQWILKRQPSTWLLPDGTRVAFSDLWGVEYTGLQVRRDPGVWIVYLGCIAMSLGLFVAFFMSHRRIWVRLSEEKNQTRLLIGASSNKNRAGFERRIDRFISSLRKQLEGGQ